MSQVPGVAGAIARFDQLDAPGVTHVLQRRLILFAGAMIVGRLPCTDEVRSDASRGVTIGCVQRGLLDRLQPAKMDRAHPDQFAAAFGANVEAVRAMLKLPTIPAQVAWTRSITDPHGPASSRRGRRSSRTLAAMPEFQSAHLRSTSVRYRMAAAWAGDYGFRPRAGLHRCSTSSCSVASRGTRRLYLRKS